MGTGLCIVWPLQNNIQKNESMINLEATSNLKNIKLMDFNVLFYVYLKELELILIGL